jgi:hypothetical protein
MEINKKELRKISRKFRGLGSDAINADYREQIDLLREFIDYVDKTTLIRNYIESFKYDIDGLEESINNVYSSYGRQCLDLGSNAGRRLYLLYSTFKYILENNLNTINFGWFYANSNKYQDMAQSFGNRMVYPFISGIEEYIKDIATDMGYDDNNKYEININSSGVQVNLASDNSSIDAIQNNYLNKNEIDEEMSKLESLLENIDDEDKRSILMGNMELIKGEVVKANPNKNLLKTSFNSLKFMIGSIATLPDFIEGINKLGSLLGIIK